MKKLTIGHLYPDLLNLYGDRGNIQCFRKRLEWRGMEAEVIPFLSGEKIDFSKLDIVQALAVLSVFLFYDLFSLYLVNSSDMSLII